MQILTRYRIILFAIESFISIISLQQVLSFYSVKNNLLIAINFVTIACTIFIYLIGTRQIRYFHIFWGLIISTNYRGVIEDYFSVYQGVVY